MFVGDTGPKVFPAAPKFHRRIHSFDSTLNTTITISYRNFPRSLWSICGGFKCFAAIFHKDFPVGYITTVKECTCSYFQSLIALNCTRGQMISILRDSMLVIKKSKVPIQTPFPSLSRESKKHILEMFVKGNIDVSLRQLLLHS